MLKIGVIYWSGTGNTEAMAKSLVEGIKNAGAEADLFYVADFDAAKLDSYDKLAFGCPACGTEELDQDEFEPFFASIENNLKDKHIALFGSYEWAEGEWMQTWETRVKNKQAKLFEKGLTVYGAPDDNALQECKDFGERFAK